MLEQLHSGLFALHIGKPCRLEAGGVTIETILDEVTEKPLARLPHAAADSRTPFNLYFRAAPDCPWSDGIFTLQFEGMEAIPGVYLNRVMHIGPTPGSLFQAAFN